MIKPLGLNSDFMLMILAMTLTISPARSDELVDITQNSMNIKVSSNELSYDKSLNKYCLLGNVLIKSRTIYIRSDNIILYLNESLDIASESTGKKNPLAKLIAKSCEFNQNEITIESQRIEYDATKKKIILTNAIIRNTDYKMPFYYATAPTIIANTENGTFKAYSKHGSDKVRIAIPSKSDTKEFKHN